MTVCCAAPETSAKTMAVTPSMLEILGSREGRRPRRIRKGRGGGPQRHCARPPPAAARHAPRRSASARPRRSVTRCSRPREDGRARRQPPPPRQRSRARSHKAGRDQKEDGSEDHALPSNEPAWWDWWSSFDDAPGDERKETGQARPLWGLERHAPRCGVRVGGRGSARGRVERYTLVPYTNTWNMNSRGED